MNPTTHDVETAGKRSNKFGAQLEMLQRVGLAPAQSYNDMQKVQVGSHWSFHSQ